MCVTAAGEKGWNTAAVSKPSSGTRRARTCKCYKYPCVALCIGFNRNRSTIKNPTNQTTHRGLNLLGGNKAVWQHGRSMHAPYRPLPPPTQSSFIYVRLQPVPPSPPPSDLSVPPSRLSFLPHASPCSVSDPRSPACTWTGGTPPLAPSTRGTWRGPSTT